MSNHYASLILRDIPSFRGLWRINISMNLLTVQEIKINISKSNNSNDQPCHP